MRGWKKPTPDAPDLQEPDTATHPERRRWDLTPSRPRLGGPWGTGPQQTCRLPQKWRQTLAPALCPAPLCGPPSGLTLAWAWAPRATLLTHSSGMPAGPPPRAQALQMHQEGRSKPGQALLDACTASGGRERDPRTL